MAATSQLKSEVKQLLIDYHATGRPQSLRDQIVDKCYGLVKAAALKHITKAPVGMVLEDLEQEGAMGLMEAVDKFDIGRNVAFGTYASVLVRGRILDAIRKQSWAPRLAVDRNNVLSRVTSVFWTERGYNPTPEELRRRLRVSRAKWKRDEPNLTLQQQIPTADIVVIHPTQRLTDDSIATDDLFERSLGLLRGTERFVVFYHYLTAKSFAWIGRLAKLSEGRVSQIHTDAIEKLRNFIVHRIKPTHGPYRRCCKKRKPLKA